MAWPLGTSHLLQPLNRFSFPFATEAAEPSKCANLLQYFAKAFSYSFT
jgi:hypothetical protein